MDWKTLKGRWNGGRRGSGAGFKLPGVVLEVQPDFVAAVRLNGAGKHVREVRKVAMSKLAPQLVSPHPNQLNIANEQDVGRTIRSVMSALGNGSERLGLLVSDGAARVLVLSFETLPGDAREAEALVRWKMTDSLPFPPSEARLSYQIVATAQTHVEVLAIAAKDSVLTQYEALVEPMSGGTIMVLPATMALLPLLPDRADVGQLLLHLTSGWLTSVLLVGGRVYFWRTREIPGGDTGEVGIETARVMASARDHLRMEVGRVWLCCRPELPRGLAEELAKVVSCEIKPLVPEPSLASLLVAEEKRVFERVGAPAAGLIRNSLS